MQDRSNRSGFLDFWRREIGFSSPRKFTHRVSGSEGLLKHVDLYGTLEGHEGCVNTLHFNSNGDFLVSGSDDMHVIFWNWTTKTKSFSYASGHSDNIFQAKIMPFTDDRTIVTSSADGEIRLGEVLENGHVDTKILGEHEGAVHSLAIEPGSPHIFYSCGEDGDIQHFDLRSHSAANLFCCSSFVGNRHQHGRMHLNAIIIDRRNPNYFAVGGEDGYARLYDIRNYQLDASSPRDRPVDTFCPSHLIGSNNVHITGLAYSNTSELLVSYSNELAYLFQKNMGLGPNPCSASPENSQKLDQPQVYTGHRNSMTVKGINFFGPNDEYAMSGSDCGHIFIWKKKGGELMRVMAGDRRIVNCLESHPHIPVLASSGLEDNIKLWAPMTNDCNPLPANIQEILEANKQSREDQSRVTLSSDVIMHILRLQRRQPLVYIERRHTRADVERDGEDEGQIFIVGDDSSDEDLPDNPGECTMS